MDVIGVVPTVAVDVASRARRRIAARLLPFVFIIYIVNYIDRVERIVRQSPHER
jgi:hypothetical protein